MEKRIEIKVDGFRCVGIVHIPKDVKGSCVLCHGLLSSKESPKYKLLGKVFSEMGLATVRFDFRGCGESDMELKDTTLTTRIEDTLAWTEFMRREFGGKLFFMGSSLGGVCVSIALREENPVATALWATPVHFRGVRDRANTIPQLGEGFIKELEGYDATEFIPHLKRPIVIHGTEDGIVPPYHAEIIYTNAPEPKKLVMVEGADHIFTERKHLERAVFENREWFKKFLEEVV